MAKVNGAMEYSVVSCVSACLSFVADYHWSSTEDSATNAWKLNFNNGNQNNNNKNNNNYVRAFRKWLIIQTLHVLHQLRTFFMHITIAEKKNAILGVLYVLKKI